MQIPLRLKFMTRQIYLIFWFVYLKFWEVSVEFRLFQILFFDEVGCFDFVDEHLRLRRPKLICILILLRVYRQIIIIS